jgi:hypothetical protein
LLSWKRADLPSVAQRQRLTSVLTAVVAGVVWCLQTEGPGEMTLLPLRMPQGNPICPVAS